MPFLVLALSIAFIVIAIVVLRLHPFLSLVLAAILVGLLSPRPLARAGASREGESQAVLALELTAEGFGATAAGIGIAIVLAAIVGQCLMASGAADRIVGALLSWFGERRAGASLLAAGYVLSIPVFFDTVFLLLVPIARSLRRRTGRSYVLFVTAIAAGAFLTHSLVPPTPGPLLMAEALSVDLGVAILAGFLLGIVPAAAGLAFAHFVDRRLEVPLRSVTGAEEGAAAAADPARREDLPGLFVSLLPVVLPVALISGHSLVDLLERFETTSFLAAWKPWSGFLGNKNFALLLAALSAMSLWKRRERLSLGELSKRLEPALASGGVIILITSAGGAFGSMLSRTGIDDTLRTIQSGGGGAIYILLAFGIAAVLKVAQGSGTVSIITTAGIMAALLPDPSALGYHSMYVYAAIGFGSGLVSWMNDSGFWVVCKMSGFTEKETFLTWSAVLFVMGIVGLAQVLILSALLPFA